MKQIIPFKKELLFKTKVSEITSISLEHTLTLKNDDLISGEFHITGDYKMTEGSINREKFAFQLPFDIALDSRYDTSSMIIDIDNFYYEIINNESLQVNIDVYVEGKKVEHPSVIPTSEKEEEVESSNQEPEPILDNLNFPDLETALADDESTKELKRGESQHFIPEQVINTSSKENSSAFKTSTPTSFSQPTKNFLPEEPPTDSNIDVPITNFAPETDQAKEQTETMITKPPTPEININNFPFGEEPSRNIKYNAPTLTNLPEETTPISHKNEFNIFENIDNSDTYVTYHVYIIKESDNIEKIIEKYGVTKDEIALYNNLEDIKPGTKLIIPNKNE